MTAAIRVVMPLRMLSLTVGVVMTAAIRMVMSLRMRSLTVGVVATIFAAGGGVMMFLLSRKHRGKPQRCQGQGQQIIFHCFSVN